MIKVSLVSYLNSSPFKWGLNNYSIPLNMELSMDFPAACASKLINNEVDLGLVPIAVLPYIKNAQIVSPFGIGANGKVDSVLLVSNSPIDLIKEVTLDYQSRSSIALTRLLFKHYFKKEVEFINAQPNYLNQIETNEAKVIIGDRALALAQNYTYVWDLPDVWKQFTGLPFVFAAWVSNKQIDDSWLLQFNNALEFGLSNMDSYLHEIISEYPYANVEDYLKNKIKYRISGDDYQKSIEKFLGFLKNLEGY